VRLIVLSGAMLGMISSLLVFQLGQARVWFAMSRDGLLPRLFSHVHPRFRTPDTSTWIAGLVVGIPAGLFDIGTFADLSNIGTLFAFALVAGGVLILRYRDPHRKRGFRASAEWMRWLALPIFLGGLFLRAGGIIGTGLFGLFVALGFLALFAYESFAPIMTILTCLLLMAGLPIMNWLRFFAWLSIGLVIYFTYSRRHSEFAKAGSQ
jgi:APA family basic amino acid/polyamine antiporter